MALRRADCGRAGVGGDYRGVGVMTAWERMEANADLIRWCVHILGMDDVRASPSHDAAVVAAREFNRAVWSRASSPVDVLCFAYAAPWPHSDQSHADDLKKWPNAPQKGDE